MNYIGSLESIDEHGWWKLYTWRTSTQEIGVTLRKDGLYLYVQDLDGANYRSAMKRTVLGAYWWIVNELRKGE